MGLFGVVKTFGRVYGTEVNSEKYPIAAYFVRVDGLARSWLVKIGWKTPPQKTRKEPTSKEPISSFPPAPTRYFPIVCDRLSTLNWKLSYRIIGRII